jgi:chaperone BCS1
MDVWIEFRNASKHQAEGLFRNFFPAAEEFEDAPPASSLFAASIPTSPSSAALPTAASTLTSSATPASTPSTEGIPQSLKDTLPSLESATSVGAPSLDADRLAELAKIFAEAIPDEEFSVAELQGYLLKNKARPEEAASQAGQWVIKEREMREKLVREKEEKEEKERLIKEKRRKDREEKNAKDEKEKEEKARKEREETEEKARKEKEEKVSTLAGSLIHSRLTIVQEKEQALAMASEKGTTADVEVAPEEAKESITTKAGAAKSEEK